MYLKKGLEILGLSILVSFSFIITDKAVSMINDNDTIMSMIKENSLDYELSSVDAIINEDEIIPGSSGRIVDVNKSYEQMRNSGMYHADFFVFNDVQPSISIEDNYDKYIIGGNRNRKVISMIFKINSNNNLNNVINILNNYKVRANFFIDGNWAENNLDQIKKFFYDDNIIGSLGYSGNFIIDDNYWLNNLIKRNSKQHNYYCYLENKDNDVLSRCSKDKNYTILSKFTVNNNLLSQTKKKLESGLIISIVVNDSTIKELPNTINYIISKGYKFVNLDELIAE